MNRCSWRGRMCMMSVYWCGSVSGAASVCMVSGRSFNAAQKRISNGSAAWRCAMIRWPSSRTRHGCNANESTARYCLYVSITLTDFGKPMSYVVVGRERVIKWVIERFIWHVVHCSDGGTNNLNWRKVDVRRSSKAQLVLLLGFQCKPNVTCDYF